MQKKIIALAVAGLVSGVAFAQTNVTVYGSVDAAYTYSKQGDAKFSGIESGGLNGGRVGFRGEEALGNGLKAVFTYELGNNSDDNSAFNQTRQAFVGLAGNFGSLTLGRQYAPSGSYLGATNANDITSVNPTNLMLGAYFDSLETGGGSRWNNSISYNSPNWSGFDMRVIYSFGENVRDSFSDASNDASKFGLGLRYANGPLYLTAMYQAVLDNDGTTPAGTDVDISGNKAWAIGGNYDFKVVKLYANYIREKYNDIDDSKHTLWSLGLGIPVSAAGTVKVEYMQHKFNNIDDTKSKGFGVGYEHDLSKRTRLYGYVSRVQNDDNVAWGFSKNLVVGENSTNLQLGIRHFF